MAQDSLYGTDQATTAPAQTAAGNQGLSLRTGHQAGAPDELAMTMMQNPDNA